MEFLNKDQTLQWLAQLDASFLLLDPQDKVIQFNQAACDLFGLTSNQVLGLQLADLVASKDYQPLQQALKKLRAGQAVKPNFNCHFYHNHGDNRSAFLSFFLNSKDNQVQLIIQPCDSDALTKQQSMARMIIEHSGNGILITDHNDTIVQVNPAFYRISGYSPAEIIGRKPFLLRSGEHDESFYNRIWKSLQQTDLWQGEICYRHRDGSLFYVWESISAVYNSEGQADYFISNMADMTELKQRQQALDDLANYDPLTDLPNRNYFNANLTQAIEISRRQQHKVALLFIDLDKFKPINDKYGHNAGDQLLIEVANRIENSVRKQDTAARFGGDEFVVLLPNMDDDEQLNTIARRVLKRLAAPVELSPNLRVTISASIGVSIYPDDMRKLDSNPLTPGSSKANELLDLADQAMYAAKEKQEALCFYSQIESNDADKS